MNLIETAAWAQAEGAPPPGGLGMLPLLVVMFALMYFLIIRPQAKRAKKHETMIKALSKGDEIVTSDGILGKITELEDDFVKLRISANTEIMLQRRAIGGVMPKGTFKL